MSDNAIRVNNLGKMYRIGETIRHDTFRDVISNFFTNSFKFKRVNKRSSRSTIWALKGVSFEVKKGEVVGIIGRNGAGKTTLLKILSRITEPAEGRAQIHGRVGSLLEVGTGFHPELTGRENIFLNGAILGMTRREIKNKFDEIVAFAEIEKFIDTPVKRYSSGMYVRLAFAVAAHLEPEILIVDEVLAVGDIAFQKKCLGKMGDVAKEGRTVLFVSHNMQAVTRLCSRAILLDKGRLVADGKSSDIAISYLRDNSESFAKKTWPVEYNPNNSDAFRLISARLVDQEGQERSKFDISEPITVEIIFQRLRSNVDIAPNCMFYYEEGTVAFIITPHQILPEFEVSAAPGMYSALFTIPSRLLNTGAYSVLVALTSGKPFYVHYAERDALSFLITENLKNWPMRARYGGNIGGIVRPILDFKCTACREL